MPEVWCWYKNVYGRNRASWSALRVDTGKHVDFCRGFVLSTAERGRVTYFKSDRAYGVLLFHRARAILGLERYSYSSGLTLPLLASDTPFLALDVLRA